MAARKSTAKPRKKAAKKSTASAAPSTGSPPGNLLPGELPGSVPFRHPDTGERISRSDYIRIVAEQRTADTQQRWADAIAAGKLDRSDD